MPQDQLRTALDGLRARIQAELDAQLDAISQNYEQTLQQVRQAVEVEAEERSGSKVDALQKEWAARLQCEVAAARSEVERGMAGEITRIRVEAAQAAAEAAARARHDAESEAEQRWMPRLDAVQAEWAARLRSELAAARSEFDRAMVTESMRFRVEAEQAAAESGAHARRETEQALLLERESAQADLEAERQRSREEREQLEAQHQRVLLELEAQHQRARLELEAEHQRGGEDLKAERQRARAEVEAERQRAGEEAEAERQRAGAEVEAERQRAREELEAERQRARTEIDAEQQRGEAALEAERESGQALLAEERQSAEDELIRAREAVDLERGRSAGLLAEARRPVAPAINTPGLLAAVRAIDEATSLTDALAATVRGAALEAPRAALFIVNGTELREWTVAGVPTVHASPIRSDDRGAGLLGEALRSQEPVMTDQNGGPPAPAFAALPHGRVALAVPFVLGGQPVAVLYADEGADGQAPTAWQDMVQILGRHASACIAYLTTLRTAQAMQLIAADGSAVEPGRDPDQDDAQGARRYARLLVSEIKLYNESAVRTGRERRDLLERLKPEIERARRLYDERVAPSIHSRDVYFQQELVQTLADGDQSLLG
jgi:hypothetical protein